MVTNIYWKTCCFYALFRFRIRTYNGRSLSSRRKLLQQEKNYTIPICSSVKMKVLLHNRLQNSFQESLLALTWQKSVTARVFAITALVLSHRKGFFLVGYSVRRVGYVGTIYWIIFCSLLIFSRKLPLHYIHTIRFQISSNSVERTSKNSRFPFWRATVFRVIFFSTPVTSSMQPSVRWSCP